MGKDRGRLRLRWRYQGRQKTLALALDDNPRNRMIAEEVARQIEADFLDGTYDQTLVSYRPSSSGRNTSEIRFRELFDKYIKAKGLGQSGKDRYRTLYNHIKAFFREDRASSVGLRGADQFKRYLLQRVDNNSARGYIFSLKAVWEWAEGRYAIQPGVWVADIKSKKKPRRQPFTQREVAIILKAFKEQQPHYLNFVTMLFLTAARPIEIIRLKWGAVDYDMRALTIWATKTQAERKVYLQPGATKILQSIGREKDSVLVFTDPKGRQIPQSKFNTRIWRPVIESTSISYRSCYLTRHTAISLALSRNVPPMDVAQASGHSLDTLIKYYASSINQSPAFTDITGLIED